MPISWQEFSFEDTVWKVTVRMSHPCFVDSGTEGGSDENFQAASDACHWMNLGAPAREVDGFPQGTRRRKMPPPEGNNILVPRSRANIMFRTKGDSGWRWNENSYLFTWLCDRGVIWWHLVGAQGSLKEEEGIRKESLMSSGWCCNAMYILDSGLPEV